MTEITLEFYNLNALTMHGCQSSVMFLLEEYCSFLQPPTAMNIRCHLRQQKQIYVHNGQTARQILRQEHMEEEHLQQEVLHKLQLLCPYQTALIRFQISI